MMGGDPSAESPNQASGIYNSDSKSEYATVIYYYDAKEEDELTLRVGDVIEVLSKAVSDKIFSCLRAEIFWPIPFCTDNTDWLSK